LAVDVAVLGIAPAEVVDEEPIADGLAVDDAVVVVAFCVVDEVKEEALCPATDVADWAGVVAVACLTIWPVPASELPVDGVDPTDVAVGLVVGIAALGVAPDKVVDEGLTVDGA